jgi:hypothetical protein
VFYFETFNVLKICLTFLHFVLFILFFREIWRVGGEEGTGMLLEIGIESGEGIKSVVVTEVGRGPGHRRGGRREGRRRGETGGRGVGSSSVCVVGWRRAKVEDGEI